MTSIASNKHAMILLAAGFSRRFGSNKLAYPLNNGQSLLETTIKLCEQAGVELFVVVKNEHKRIIENPLNTSTHIVIANDAHQGMSASLKAGIKAARNSTACMVALADMPYIMPSTFTTLLSYASADSIVVPVAVGEPDASRFGNPVVFGRKFYPELLALEGDRGGKIVVQEHFASVQSVWVEDPGIYQDIDEPSDLMSFH